MRASQPGISVTARPRIYSSIELIDPGEWMAVIDAAGAAAFYDYTFLRAYESAPLQETDAFFYLVFGDPAVAVLPAYVQSTDDAIGTIPGLGLPGRSPGDRIMLTHVAHCYDTIFPAVAGTRPVRAACAALDDIARQEGVKWFAFLNVEGDTPVAHELEAAGLTRIPMNTRFRVDIGAYSGVEEFVSAIPSKKTRFRLRQNQRETERLGLEISHPAPADAGAAVELCRRTTARHGTPDYYPERFHEFVRLAAAVVRVEEVRLAGQLAAAAICLHDRTRFHLWAGGIDYEVTARLHSSFAMLLWPSIADAIALDARVFEGGRGNQANKSRYRLSPVPLFAFVGST